MEGGDVWAPNKVRRTHLRKRQAWQLMDRTTGQNYLWGLLPGWHHSELLSPSGDLGIGLVWDNNRPPPHRDYSVRLLKSSSNWTKSSMMGPQLFLGWYQMILDVFRCSQLFSDVFSWVVTFMDNHPLCRHFFSIDHRYSLENLRYVKDVLRYSQMFTDVFRWSQMFLDFL